jgi:hypothetical protein
MSIHHIPIEIYSLIGSNLDGKSNANLGMTCRNAYLGTNMNLACLDQTCEEYSTSANVYFAHRISKNQLILMEYAVTDSINFLFYKVDLEYRIKRMISPQEFDEILQKNL